MSCQQNNNCIPCQSECVGEGCLPKNYQDVRCEQTYPLKCSIYSGSDIVCLDIKTGDTADVIVEKLSNALCNAVIPSADIKFKISANDGQHGYFEEKLFAGTGITFTKSVVGGSERITVSANGGASSPSLTMTTDATLNAQLSGSGNHTVNLSTVLSSFAGNLLSKRNDGLYVANPATVKVSNLDTTAGNLLDKLQAGSNITLTKQNAGGNETILISATGSTGLTSVTRNSTSTISFSGTGASNSALTASVKISTNPSNLLGVDGEGLLVLAQSDGKLKVSGLDASPNFLVNKLLAGTNVSITSSVISGSEVLTISSSQTPLTATSSSTINFSTSGANNHTLTGNVKVSAIAGNLITVQSDGLHVLAPTVVIPPIIGNDSSSIDFTVSGLDNHTITGSVKVSSTIGNSLTIDGTGLFVPAIPVYTAGTGISIVGTTISSTIVPITNYDELSNIPLFSNGITKTGTDTKLGGTLSENTTIALDTYVFNISGAGYTNFVNTKTYSSGTSAVIGAAANVTYSGTLPTANTSFSSIVNNHNSIFNGNTTVGGDTPFGSSIISSIVSFSSTGTVTMNNGTGGGLKSIAAIIAGTFDNGSTNGTVTRSSGIQINGIFKTVGSTAVITRTDHYQLLINDTNEFSGAGNITNKWGVYQVGANDTNLFNGQFILPNLPVYADNTAASSLAVGTLYRTSTGVVMVRY